MLPEELSSDRLVLSVPVDADIDRIAEYCDDPLVEKFLPLPVPYARADAEAFVREFVPAGWAEDRDYEWAIREEAGGPLLGMIGWRTRGDVGFWMGAPHRGKGFVTEALIVVVEWVFGEQRADEIRWEATAGNLGSAHVAHRAGFTFDGARPLTHPDRHGTHPEGWHGILRRDDSRDLKDGWPL